MDEVQLNNLINKAIELINQIEQRLVDEQIEPFEANGETLTYQEHQQKIAEREIACRYREVTLREKNLDKEEEEFNEKYGV